MSILRSTLLMIRRLAVGIRINQTQVVQRGAPVGAYTHPARYRDRTNSLLHKSIKRPDGDYAYQSIC